MNIGFATLSLSSDASPHDLSRTIELLSPKIGIVGLVPGTMHLGNLITFARIRHRWEQDRQGRSS